MDLRGQTGWCRAQADTTLTSPISTITLSYPLSLYPFMPPFFSSCRVPLTASTVPDPQGYSLTNSKVLVACSLLRVSRTKEVCLPPFLIPLRQKKDLSPALHTLPKAR